MSVVDQLKNLLAKKKSEAAGETTGSLSLGSPEATMDPFNEPSQAMMLPGADDPDSIDTQDHLPEAERVSIPLLGRRSIVAHQRVLFTMLAGSLLVPGSVAVFAVNQADKVAQQVRNTGDSLTQSQRLAKSVTQALVG